MDIDKKILFYTMIVSFKILFVMAVPVCKTESFLRNNKEKYTFIFWVCCEFNITLVS